MNRVKTLLAVVVLLASLVVACTPKPQAADPVVEEFLAAFAARNTDDLVTLVDDPETAVAAINSTYDGLQAEGLEISAPEVSQNVNQATARYSMTWTLPRDRELSYDTHLVLTKTDEEWTVRWQPTIVHPELGANQALELRPVPAQAASVVSSDGAELMSPGVAHRVLVDTSLMGDARISARAIAAALQAAHDRDETVRTVDEDQLAAELESASGVYSVAMVNAQQGPLVADELSGYQEILLNEEAAMVNNDPSFAPDIMSRVGPLVADELEGANGWKVSIVNENGAELGEVEHHAADPAPAVRVSLDRNVQAAAETAVHELPDETQAVIVSIRPSTGEILAVAQTKAADAQGNIGLMGQYPPGSVFKIITAAAGIERHGLNPATVVGCPGTQTIFGRTVTNYQGFSLGNVPLRSAFAQSCNTTFAEMSFNLAPGELQETGREFGLGVDYDIPGLDTVTGQIPHGDVELDRTEAGYGQGLTLASPFGFALVSATAAAGYRPTPYLVQGEQTIINDEPPQPDPEVIGQVQEMMRAVVTEGTAQGIAGAGEVHGKTGEAEVNEGSHAWFTGYRGDLAFATLVVFGGGSNISVDITNRFLTTLDEILAGPHPEEAPPVA